MIELYIVSFVAGILTVLAPCMLPLLPIILGASTFQQTEHKKLSILHPIIIISSLIVSIVLFTLLLKFTTALIGVPTIVWSLISGGIVLLFGINLLFPMLWERFVTATKLSAFSNKLMDQTDGKTGYKKDIILGAALGPVFNSCSPTYTLIVAVILPAAFITGLGYLVAYSVGLGLMLLLISIFGRAIVSKVRWLSNPNGAFTKVLGVLFIVVGLCIVLGLDKRVQTYVLDNGWYDPIMRIEKAFHQN